MEPSTVTSPFPKTIDCPDLTGSSIKSEVGPESGSNANDAAFAEFTSIERIIVRGPTTPQDGRKFGPEISSVGVFNSHDANAARSKFAYQLPNKLTIKRRRGQIQNDRTTDKKSSGRSNPIIEFRQPIVHWPIRRQRKSHK